MAAKNAPPTREQLEIIKRNGLPPACWVVLQDMQHSMIIRHRVTGEVKVVDKK